MNWLSRIKTSSRKPETARDYDDIGHAAMRVLDGWLAAKPEVLDEKILRALNAHSSMATYPHGSMFPMAMPTRIKPIRSLREHYWQLECKVPFDTMEAAFKDQVVHMLDHVLRDRDRSIAKGLQEISHQRSFFQAKPDWAAKTYSFTAHFKTNRSPVAIHTFLKKARTEIENAIAGVRVLETLYPAEARAASELLR